MRRAMKSINLKTLLVASALSVQIWADNAHAATTDIDRIVAVVNNDVITAYELHSRTNQVLHQLAGQNTQAPPRKTLEKQLLERMISERSLLQYAEDTNIRVEGPQLDRTLANIAQRNKLSPEAFRQALEAEGVDFDTFREQIRTELIISRLREREVENRIVVTDAEIDNFQSTDPGEADKPEEYRLGHLLVLTPEGASPEKLTALREKAEKALSELHKGSDFAQISATYSDAQNALEGGMLGWRTPMQLPTLFLDAIKPLKIGDTTTLLRSPNGFHILKLFEKRGKDVRFVVKQTLARHILIKTNEVVTDAEAHTRLTQLRERIENGQNFSELAKLHSDDLSASKGGELGWLNPGDTVPDFERAMDALQPGQISEPVHSPFGWHLIRVEERRDKDVSEERKRLEARRAIRQRKADEAFDDWIRKTRDQAYVEVRLED